MSEIPQTTKFMFQDSFGVLSDIAAGNAIRHGFSNDFPTTIALIHAELSEALEAYRASNPPSDHIPEFSGIEEELADAIIRIMDVAGKDGHRVGEAVIAKMKFNETRPHKHGGKKC